MIYQDPDYQAVSSASVLLVDYTLKRMDEKARTVWELGSGCGIVSIMLALQRPLWQLHAVELQAELIPLAQANAAACKVEIDFQQADLRFWETPDKAHLIVANPPWMPLGSGLRSPLPGRAIGREEIFCTMSDILTCLERNLSSEGQAILIYPNSREKQLRQELLNSSLDIIDINHSNEPSKYLLVTLCKQTNLD